MFRGILRLHTSIPLAIGAVAALAPVLVVIASDTSEAERAAAIFVRGDVNQDGFTDVRDLLLAADYLNGYATVPVIEAIDVEDNGILDENDLIRLARLVAGHGYFSPEVLPLRRGDLNDDGLVDGRDLRALFDYLYRGHGITAPLDNADVDDDGFIELRDATRLWSLILAAGEE